jgi:TrmH family RNA methyltransferase
MSQSDRGEIGDPNANFGDLLSGHGPQLVVVLVEVSDGRNIGAVARAMSNLGISELRLVNPARFDTRIASGVACWGAEVLNKSLSFAGLKEAIADCHEVVGFASDSGGHKVPQLLLERWGEVVSRSTDHRVALVFGSEENGLKREHFPLCQYLLRIPSSGENRSYNLAQSVLLALYSIRVAQPYRAGYERVVGVVGEDASEDLPRSGQLEPLTEMVLKLAREVGFLNEHSPMHIEDLISNLVRRGRMTTRELKLITGLVGMMERRISSFRLKSCPNLAEDLGTKGIIGGAESPPKQQHSDEPNKGSAD